MTTETYAITEAQRNVLLSNHLLLKHETDILKSLPLVTEEPVAWLAPWYIEPTMHSEADDGLEMVEPSAEGAFPVYTHAQPLQPITADDVGNELVYELWHVGLATHTGAEGKAFVAKIINAWIKHRGDTK